ncbi:MAG: M23 family metallopeptidase [Firmicutes bacterium]|nr:M23 family metallopeptidase [Bacillota bacterium]
MTTATANNKDIARAKRSRQDRDRGRAIGISALLIMLMLTIAITFTALSLSGNNNRDEEVGGGAIVFGLPVAGEFEILKGFSDTQLQWNQTLGDWRAHRAVSISADQGTHVLATQGGTVSSVLNTVYGRQVTIDHVGGYQTVFKSLDPDIRVTQGDRVEKGERIGTVGTTSRIDFTTTPHVRVEVYRNGMRIDPASIIDFGDK